MSAALGIVKFLLLAALTLLAAIFLVRAIQATRAPSLELWHTHVPDEPSPGQIDGMDWQGWLVRENATFADVQAEVVDKLTPELRRPQNRYWSGAPMHPARLPRDWNRSFELKPAGEAAGVAVLLHGLTDSPYSLRHVGLHYQSRGWAVVAVRLPGHGTVPAGLTKASVEQWEAATRLAVREAMKLAPGKPLHLVGYSNGGALAVGHALDALSNPALGQPQRIILFSPMVGLTPFARFTGLAGMPAVFPAFVGAAWLDVIPEYNPFKYNSFPVRAGAEAHRLTEVLAQKIERAKADGSIARMPPVLGFQSAVDSTVSAPAVVAGLYDHLPANGSELVLFDVNHGAYVGPLVRRSAQQALEGLLPRSARRYAIRVVTNAHPGSQETLVRSFAAGSTGSTDQPLAIPYRRDFFSLGHVALPFPLSDGLYGANPDPADVQGVALGALATRGENGVLSISPAALSRVSSNPFFPWVLEQIDAVLPGAA
jgi:alpha-beta hydrolase superfamily lysophospholipase